jgi:hypothetical protein
MRSLRLQEHDIICPASSEHRRREPVDRQIPTLSTKMGPFFNSQHRSLRSRTIDTRGFFAHAAYPKQNIVGRLID